MKAGYLWLLSFGLFPLAGWPLLAHASYRGLSRPCRIGLAAAVGCVLVSFWMTAAALAGIAWQPLWLIVFAILTAFLLRLPLSGDKSPTWVSEAEGSAVGLPRIFAVLLTCGALAAAFAATATAAATSADLLIFWGPKAQAFAAARTIDAAFLRDPYLLYVHPSYPPLVTNLFAFSTMVAGRFAWGAVTFTFPLFLAALALALPGLLRQSASARLAAGASAFIVAALGFLGSELDVAGNGDPALWLFETSAAAILIGSAGPTAGGRLLAGLLFAGAACAKVEGLIFVALAGAFFLFLRRREVRLLSTALYLFLPTALSLAAWFAFGRSRHLFTRYESYGPILEIHWEILPTVLSGIGSQLWLAGFALPFLLPLLALVLAPGKSRLAILPVGVSVVLAVFFVFTYLHGDPHLSSWIGWSAGRIFSPLAALLALASVVRGSGSRSGRMTA